MTPARQRWWLLGVLAFGIACPIPTTTVPEVVITVVDPQGEPIEGARVVLVTGAYPHDPVVAQAEQRTDAHGRASWSERTEWQRGCLCIPHGLPAYYWVACAESDGRAVAADVRPTGEPLSVELVLDRDGPHHRCDVGSRADEWTLVGLPTEGEPTSQPQTGTE